jgi:hypothetical protein
VLVYALFPREWKPGDPDATGLAAFALHLAFADVIQLEALRRRLLARRDGLEGAGEPLTGCCCDCRRKYPELEFASPVHIENLMIILPDNGRERDFDATPLADLLPLARDEERDAVAAIRERVEARALAGSGAGATPWDGPEGEPL